MSPPHALVAPVSWHVGSFWATFPQIPQNQPDVTILGRSRLATTPQPQTEPLAQATTHAAVTYSFSGRRHADAHACGGGGVYQHPPPPQFPLSTILTHQFPLSKSFDPPPQFPLSTFFDPPISTFHTFNVKYRFPYNMHLYLTNTGL